MNSKELKRISEYRHFSELSDEELITSVGLYDSMLINTEGMAYNDRTNDELPTISLSKDVNTLTNFIHRESPIMLPCPYCKREQAFAPLGYFNPSIEAKTVRMNLNNKGVKTMQLFTGSTSNTPLYGADYEPDESSYGVENSQDEKKACSDFVNRAFYSFGARDICFDKWNVFDKNIEFNKVDAVIASKVCDEIVQTGYDIRKDFVCSYNSKHRLYIEFSISRAIDETECDNDITEEERSFRQNLQNTLVIKKIAQYPSMADMQFFEAIKYKSVLGREYADFTRALGLNASGVGTGAFVYLRRIMESLVEDAHKRVQKSDEWSDKDEELYTKLRFDEKIDKLEEHGEVIIPSELQQIRKKLYHVLSMGIHLSSEEECMTLFPYMRFAIEIMLDRVVAEEERRKRIVKLNKTVSKIET